MSNNENPFDSQQIGFGVRLVCHFVKFLLILICGFGILTVYKSASAHDFWMSDKRYLSRDGGHCCGPNDCKYLDEWQATVVETDTTYEVFTEHFGSLSFSKKRGSKDGLYFTEDADNKPVLCIYRGKIVCLAVKRTGTF